MMVKYGRCFMTYHLGMVLAIIQVCPKGNQTLFLGVPDMHAMRRTYQSPDTKINVIVGIIRNNNEPKIK